MMLSKNLSLSEMTKSTTAKRRGIDNSPTEEHIENMKVLAEKIFQPIRDYFGVPFSISSGYRSKALNEAIGGSKTSQHCLGEAIDIDDVYSKATNADFFNYIKARLEFDQLIWEFGDDNNPAWVHVSYRLGNNRMRVLKAIKENGRTKYINITNE